jgi:hypothetical protein
MREIGEGGGDGEGEGDGGGEEGGGDFVGWVSDSVTHRTEKSV